MGALEGHEQEETGWFPPVTLLPAKITADPMRNTLS